MSSANSNALSQYQDKWNEIQASSIDDQADTFLRAYVNEFAGGRFEEVLNIASEFKKFARDAKSNELEEYHAHLFLEKRGETLTAARLRELLKEIDIDNNHRMAFIEYCLFKYQKSVTDFFTELAKPKVGGSAALEAAIKAYRAILAKREEREAKMEELEKIAQQGGVKGMAAKNQLEQMKSEDQLNQNRAEITAAAKKRAAEKNASDPFEEEKKRLEAEAKAKAEEDARKKQESRDRLAAKAALWNSPK